jgi:hypothetical protein
MGSNNSEFVRWNATAGVTYYIVVDGYLGDEGSFTLQIGTSTIDVILNEVSSDIDDFVELINLGACDVGLSTFSIHHKPSDEAAFDFTFPGGSIISAGGVFRAIEDTAGTLMSNEVSLAPAITDFRDGHGFTVLCDGVCDIGGCSNVLDYVERDPDTGDGIPVGGPACLNFSPAPMDATSINSGQSLIRSAADGLPPDFLSADWTIGSVSRD